MTKPHCSEYILPAYFKLYQKSSFSLGESAVFIFLMNNFFCYRTSVINIRNLVFMT